MLCIPILTLRSFLLPLGEVCLGTVGKADVGPRARGIIFFLIHNVSLNLFSYFKVLYDSDF